MTPALSNRAAAAAVELKRRIEVARAECKPFGSLDLIAKLLSPRRGKRVRR